VGWCQSADFLRWATWVGHALHGPRSPRWVMQQWGSFRRATQPLYWVQQVEAWVQYQRAHGAPGLVITDVRATNEAHMLRWLGGHLVRVHRPGLPALPPDVAGHESEQHTDLQADADLHNDGDLQHLDAELARVLQILHPTIPTTTTGAPTHG
jgi:hypothetical protein